MNKLYECQTEHLKDYKGIGEAPEDYDEYWARAKKDLEEASLDYELVKSDFVARSCEAYDLYFTGIGGARIHCQFLKPKKIIGKAPAIAMFHGYWSNCGEWSGKLQYIAEGFCVLAMDVRGQGGTSIDNGTYKGNTQSGHIIRGLEGDSPDDMFYRNVYLDTAQCVRILQSMEFVDKKNVFATGASQGGALAIACASLVDDLKGAVAIYPFLCDFRGIYQNNFICPSYEEITWYFRQRDPNHLTEDFFFERLGYIDLKNRAKDIKCNVLWMTALMDKVCPPFSQMAAYNNISSEKNIIFFPEYEHEYLLNSGDIILKYFIERLEAV
ncbi:acetylxylan esterase [Clostridium thermarum]|uniref:acetylxylan esterase n=1 Tax=Clostridium thermarum TaxID=1716543 RepID=UPI0013D409CC|nr:alpha/beta fold hydrolase [Clostridium thermarum]